ncbi:putative cupin superfamily sugar epimerase [Bacillus pakistanensis]|uniref:Cupin superfamily sugar epimerase n=1 Tax=Rossellomorea pakistanensis TaxID=992288 RepID=A0ABS2NBG7_9BACI|nr:cupin domain-containing protein [Bacillus pakistanensis]MBM7585159.1 putative cupin superfamily sugar epimerase [Bacillus pakistanensis]
MKTAEWIISTLNMTAHPEGGYYAPSFQSEERIEDGTIRKRFDDDRKLWTSIYFLLKEDEVSHFHKLKSDELWYFHEGSSLTIYMILPTGELRMETLGLDLEKGERPQVLVPKGTIFGSAMNGEGFTLVGCMVSPGFDFADFRLFKREDLLARFGEHKTIIDRLTRK